MASAFPEIPPEVDIAVIGLGPAGSSVALACAKAGLRVLALDRRQEIGSPVQCGEGLSRSSLERMGIDVDMRWVNQEIMGARVYAPNEKSIVIDYEGPEGWVIERKIFDKMLAKMASTAGATVIAKTNVLCLLKENGKVSGIRLRHHDNEYDVKARIVIAADGVESKLAREAGINTTLKLIDVCTCAQFEMSGIKIDSKRIEFFFGNEIAPGGYAWIFPKGKDHANVGIGIRFPFAKDSALNCLKSFIRSRPGLRKGSIVETNCGAVPVGGFLDRMVADNFMVVGDAARHVNPIHGGGISEAFVGGRIAGEVAASAIKSNDTSEKVLKEYERLWWGERGNKLKKILKLREVIESMTDEDLNWLAEYLQGEDLVDLAKGSGLKRLAKILMKKPRLLKFARKLL